MTLSNKRVKVGCKVLLITSYRNGGTGCDWSPFYARPTAERSLRKYVRNNWWWCAKGCAKSGGDSDTAWDGQLRESAVFYDERSGAVAACVRWRWAELGESAMPVAVVSDAESGGARVLRAEDVYPELFAA